MHTLRALKTRVCGSASDWAAATTATKTLETMRKMKERTKVVMYSATDSGRVREPEPART